MADSPLIDKAVRRQVLLERLKAGQIRDFVATTTAIERIVRKEFGNLDGELTGRSRRAINRILDSIGGDISREYAKRIKLYRANLEDTAGVYATAEAFDLTSSVVGLKSLTVPDAKKAFAGALKRPMSHSGETLTGFLDTFAGRETSRVVDTIRQGTALGRTNQEIILNIIGTKRAGFRDGILERSRRSTEAVVRTATQHVASSARHNVWEENRDVVEKYQWVSTLDLSTTTQCRSLDTRQFEIDKGPTPPLHIKCRSTTIAVLAPKYDFLSEGRTRSALNGPVDASESYYDWLKAQPKATQIEALGDTRAKLFRDGGLSADRFAELNLGRNFQPLTLDQMRALEPKAFEAAGLVD